ncbi:hypothetical protein ACIOEX_01380 [Streptomyces sp. NPDC087850]|uniref:hypothetical protein n=1 Tax=Streptomyces sp. NPDC087850 TaxID=3365809 RepID=UPI00382BC4C6
MGYTNSSYGTWTNRVNTFSTSPDADVLDYINGGDSDWQELLERTGALARIQSEYRAAIEAALPAGVSLCGDEFIGPAEPDDGEFDDYPQDEFGGLDFAAMAEDIDLAPIVERNEPITLEEIGRDYLESKAKNPANTGSKMMSRLKKKPFVYLPHPDSGRPLAYYLTGEVQDALAQRPGPGSRTHTREPA